MDQPLASNDHLGNENREMVASSQVAEESGGGVRSVPSTQLGMGETASGGGHDAAAAAAAVAAAAARAPQNSLAARCGLLAVTEIQSKDLSWVVNCWAAFTLVFLIVAVGWFMVSNRWTFTATIYFVSTSLMTIGYGDIVVSSEGVGRIIDSLLILVGLAILAICASCVSQPLYSMRPKKAVGQQQSAFDVEAEIRRCCWMLAHRVIALVAVIVLGLVVFMIGEDAGFFLSFYWVVVTSSSIGYGDIVPTTTAMRWFTSFYCILSTGIMLEVLRFAGTFPFEIWTLRAEGKVFEQFSKAETASERAAARTLVERAVTEVLRLPRGGRGGGTASRSDVTLSILLLLDRVSYDDVHQVARIFDELNMGGDAPEPSVPTSLSRPTKS